VTDEVDPTLSEEEYWEQEATKLRRTGLAEIRSKAEKWETTIGTLLGIIGVVSFVEGPKKLSELERWPAQWVLIGGVALAAALAFLAIILAAKAAQGIPKHFDVLTGPALAQLNAESAENAASDLKRSRYLAIAATAVLATGTLLAWGYGLAKDTEEKVSALVVTGDGAVSCGQLKDQGSQGLALVDEDKTTILKLTSNVQQLQVVTACPPAPTASPTSTSLPSPNPSP